MHACGNPLHDIPLWLVPSIPFLAPIVVWLRARLAARRCGCGHEHEHEHDGQKHA